MMNRILGILLVIAVLAAAGLGYQVYNLSDHREQSQSELQARLEERKATVGALQKQVEKLKGEQERLKRQQAELHELRAEVTSLRERIVEASNRVQQAEAQRQQMEERVQAMSDQAETQTAQPAATASGESQRLAFHELPPGVQATLRSQYNSVRFEELSSFNKDGQPAYLMVGQQADGREVKAILDPQGTVQEQYLDVTLEELPANVARAIRANVDAAGDIGFSQAWINGNTTYTGFVLQQGPDGLRTVKVTVGEDGQLIQADDTGQFQFNTDTNP